MCAQSSSSNVNKLWISSSVNRLYMIVEHRNTLFLFLTAQGVFLLFYKPCGKQVHLPNWFTPQGGPKLPQQSKSHHQNFRKADKSNVLIIILVPHLE